MGTTFRPYSPDQELLLPPSLNEWLPEGHLAYFISDVVEELDLSAFYARYEGSGRRNSPFDPRMMLKVLIYAYATGVFSSRKIARKLEEDVALRVLAAGNLPRHRTICDFRKQHLAAFKAVFIQVVRIAQEAELVTLGTLAIDGTKVRANASKHKAMSYDRMREEEARLSKEVDELCAQARRVDESEDQQFGPDQRGDELPEELQHRQGGWTRSGQRRRNWKRIKKRKMRPKAGIQTMIAAHPRVAGTSREIMEFRRTRLRVTLPTPKAGS